MWRHALEEDVQDKENSPWESEFAFLNNAMKICKETNIL